MTLKSWKRKLQKNFRLKCYFNFFVSKLKLFEVVFTVGKVQKDPIGRSFGGMFNCTCCLQTFSSKSNLKRHQQRHTGIYHFGFNYKNVIELSELLTLKNVKESVYSRDKQLNCFLCCKRFRTSSDKSNHLKTHCGKKFQPHKYVENIFQENNLSSNVQIQPLVNVEDGFSCHKCLQKFLSKSCLKRHQLIHKGKQRFDWNHCDMKFDQIVL